MISPLLYIVVLTSTTAGYNVGRSLSGMGAERVASVPHCRTGYASFIINMFKRWSYINQLKRLFDIPSPSTSNLPTSINTLIILAVLVFSFDSFIYDFYPLNHLSPGRHPFFFSTENKPLNSPLNNMVAKTLLVALFTFNCTFLKTSVL